MQVIARLTEQPPEELAKAPLPPGFVAGSCVPAYAPKGATDKGSGADQGLGSAQVGNWIKRD